VEPYEMIERRTPGGHTAWMRARLSTNDGAVAQAILGDDEYRLASAYPLSGWAIDVGAHIGTVAIALALDNPDLRVVAVEALPENAELIAANIEHNGLGERVFLASAGATDEDEADVSVTYNYQSVDLYRGGAVDPAYLSQCRYVGNIFQYDGLNTQVSDEVTVPGLSLGSIIRRHRMRRVALLKIDCEGCEWQFLTSPAVAKVERIVGEYHDAKEFSDLVAMLEPTHRVERWTDGTVGLFGAVAR